MKKILCLALMAAAVNLSAAPKSGKPAPAFSVQDVDNQNLQLADLQGKYVVLEWFNFGCPFVRKHYDSSNMQSLQKELTEKGAVWISVNSSAPGREGYLAPADLGKAAREKGSLATYIVGDSAGVFGKLYGAKSTPHIFLIGPDGSLLYQGAIDDKPSTDSADIAGAKNYLRAAFEEAQAGTPITTPSTPSYGCSVKYKN